VDRTEPPLENQVEMDAAYEAATDGGDENTSKDKKSPKPANRKSPKVEKTEVSAFEDGSGVPIAAVKPAVADIPSEFKGSIPSRATLGSVGLSLLDGPGIIRKKSPSRDIIEEDVCPDILEADSSEDSADADELREASMKFTRIFNAKAPRSFVRASEAAARALEVQANRVILPLARSSSGRRRLGGSVQLPVPQPPSITATTTAAYPANKQAPARSPSTAIVSQPQRQIAPDTDPQVDALSNKLAGLHTQPDNKALVKSHSYNQSVSSVTSSVRSHGTDFSGRQSMVGALPAITPSTSSQMSPQPSHAATKRRAHESPAPVLGEGDVIGEGDSTLVTNLLPLDQFPDLFEKLKSEIQWETMYHRGGEVPRLVAVEADVSADGSFPLYRHPNDESPPVLPFSPTVAKIRDYAEREVGHKLNHVLIQLYRDGSDHISEHSDKTLDIVQGSKIVNVSFGAQRTMTLRAKRSSTEWEANHPHNTGGTHTPSSSVTSLGSETPNPNHNPPPARPAQKIALQHNSMFVLGQRTNAAWLHAIRPDKRSPNLKSTAETAFNGQRISFTFRHIGTFLAPHFPTLNPSDGTYLIYGQGATSKHRETARPIVPGTSPEGEKMLFAFGTENHLSDFSWSQHYGPGFDVLHFGTKPVPIGQLTYTPANNPHARMLKVLFDHTNLPVECYPTLSADDTSDDEIERRMVTFTDNRSNPPAVITAETASTILAYLNQTVPNINLFPSPAAGLSGLAKSVGLLGEVLHRIDDLALMGVPLARSGIIDRVTRLDRKVGALLDGPGLGEIGVVQIAVWCLVQECAKGGLRKRGRWTALERVWEMVGEECGVEMM
jgi:alkylated DNA repair dioxygenase AlkB